MSSHPATRQDEWALSKIPGPSTFVELGAYDGLTHSNTLLLEQNGWTGILVEGHKEFADKCRENRPGTLVKNEMIGDGSGGRFMVGGEWSGLIETMPENFLRAHEGRKNPSYVTYTKPLRWAIGRGPWGFLSVDTEGGEFEILEDWFDDGGKAYGICVEFRYDMLLLAQLEELMKYNSMTLDEVRGFDACFLTERRHETPDPVTAACRPWVCRHSD
jgi:hypothetical protein